MSGPHTSTQRCSACGKEQPDNYRFCEQCGSALSQRVSTASESSDGADTETRQGMLDQIRAEIEDLKSIAAAFGVERIRDGSWFNEFIHAMLATYAQRIIAGGGIEFFRAKYPGLTRDQIAEKLCDLATRYAALAGGASGATASAAFAATIGTAGGAGVVAVPAGLLAIMAEMLYTTRLQVRLIYDLSTVYGYPIDVEDPEDLYKAFCMAYGVAFASGNAGAAVKAATPEVARAQIRGLINGQTAAIQQVAIRVLGPRIGRQITQRAILRAAVPVVGVGISATWNYVATNAIATSARHGLRAVGRLRDAVGDVAHLLQARLEHAPLVLESMLVVITADGRFDQYEQEVFNCVVRQLDLAPEVLAQVERRVDASADSVEQRLRAIDDPALRTTLATCLRLVAIADGTVAEAEIRLLRWLLAALGDDLDLERLREQAKPFQRPANWAQQAGESISSLGSSVGATVSGWFSKRNRGASEALPEVPTGGDEPDGPLAQIRKLAQLHADGILSQSEFETKKQELLARI
jgi:tellurite resistance protein